MLLIANRVRCFEGISCLRHAVSKRRPTGLSRSACCRLDLGGTDFKAQLSL